MKRLNTLILMRHSKAEPAFASGDDLARGLTERGRCDAAAVSAKLQSANLTIEKALISPSRRTIETWRILGQVMSLDVKIVEALYLAEPDEIMDVIVNNADDNGGLIIIGHNPGLHLLSMRLAGQDLSIDHSGNSLYRGMPTSSAAIFSRIGPHHDTDSFRCDDYILAS